MAFRTRGIVGALAAALLIGAAGAGPVAAAEPSPQRPSPTVDRPTPEEVRSEVSPGEQVTVAAAIAEDDGGLRIETATAVGPAQAAAAVDTLAAQDGAVAASVSVPTVSFSDPYRLPFNYTDSTTGEPAYFPGQWASDLLCIDPTSTRPDTTTDRKNRFGPCAAHLWTTATGAGQTIAVIDSGVRTDQEDLVGLLVPGAKCMGPCVATGSTAAADVGQHGTAVASLANALTDNGLGVAGLATGAKLMPVQAFPPTGGGQSADMAAGIQWAADHGATIINVSGGALGSDDPVLKAATAYAIGKNIPVVASAGNAGPASPVVYPAAYPGVISVGAIDYERNLWSGSSQGAWVDIVAPGKDTPAIYLPPENPGTGIFSYGLWTGTSMSAPIVSGIAAAIKEKFPTLTPVALEALLTSTATQLGGNPQGVRNNAFGYGLVQPLAALAKQQQVLAAPTGLGAAPGDASATIGFTPPKVNPGVPAITKYQYAKNTGSGYGAWTDVPNGRTVSPVTFTGLTNGQATSFKLRAVNSAGPGAESVAVSATPAVPVKTQFTAIEPVRVFDSRWPEITGIDTGSLSAAGDPSGRKISVKDGRSKDGVVPGKADVVPVGATAVAYNITVFGQTASGFAAVAPASVTSTPGASTLNWTAPKQTAANGFVSAIDGNRDVRVFIGGTSTAGAAIDVVGYFSEAQAPSAPATMAAASQSVFVPISPTRVYQSTKFGDAGRIYNTTTNYQGRPIQVAKAIDANGQPAGPDVVPQGATGIAYNLTITGTRASGFLAVAPGDKLDATPSVSVINWAGSQTQANATVVGIGPNGATGDRSIGVFPAFADNGGSTHFIIDVVGYFIPKAQDLTGKGSQFVAMPPLRAYTSLASDGVLAGGNARLTSVGLDQGVPAGATAVAFNLTITGTTRSGFLSVAPGDTAVAPATSTINWSGSMTKANGSLVGVDDSRRVKTFAAGGGSSHYLLDIAGYFVP